MKYCVLGAGLMGKAVAYDLLSHKDTELVLLADSNKDNLDTAKSFLNNKRLETKLFDAENKSQIEDLCTRVDAAVGAIHYKFNLSFTEAAIKMGTHFCDLGGNNDIVDAQLKFSSKAKEEKISIIPDCGLAPGLVAVLAKWGIEKFDWAHSVKIRVGGLPVNPKGVLKYERLFSVEGLINEYIEPVRVLRNSRIEAVEPLSEIEELSFPKPFEHMEAFTTSGGTSTLVKTYASRLKNLDYKTIRYPGHGKIMRALYELGFFHGEARKVVSKLFTENIPLCKEDVTLVKVVFEGNSKSHELIIVDYSTKTPPLTSMMRTTAFSAAIISWMQAHEKIKEKGVITQENCVPAELFIEELGKRNIIVQGIKSPMFS
ncbi:MAG: saccharopine dehydrogenase NADP-binding domain-containing protein [Candidatus Melainabacteria bacterium]|nr:saccharopine dehydrogenase NADP-binding domain-containing protein [Candidatus Melainabacteria bacterium]